MSCHAGTFVTWMPSLEFLCDFIQCSNNSLIPIRFPTILGPPVRASEDSAYVYMETHIPCHYCRTRVNARQEVPFHPSSPAFLGLSGRAEGVGGQKAFQTWRSTHDGFLAMAEAFAALGMSMWARSRCAARVSKHKQHLCLSRLTESRRAIT
jgi:hypothetical protein